MANKVYNMEGGLHSAAAFSSFENAMYGACVANASSYTISAGSGMNVVLSTGDALIPTGTGFARRIHSDSTNTVSISTASTSYARKDAIVAYIDGSVSPSTSVVDNTNGILKFKSVAGSPSSSPVAPSASAIQSSVGAGNPYIVLWYVTVPKSATAMTGATFEDNRSIANVAKTENIDNNAVTSEKIANGAITGDKLSKTTIPMMGIGTTTIRTLNTISSDTTYTATRDCFVTGKANARNGSTYCTVNSRLVGGIPYTEGGAFIQVAICVPLVKGQTIQFYAGTNSDCKFEGVEVRNTTYNQNY